MTRRLPLRFTFGLLALLLLLAGRPVGACTVPVFRYALERWPADPYEVLIYVRGEGGESDEAVTRLVDRLDEAREAHPLYANVEPRVVDVDHADEVEADDLLRAWREAGEPDLPWVAVTYPFNRHGPMPAFLPTRDNDTLWTGKIDELNVDRLLDSPARREVARRLLKGDSVVWLVVESGHAAADDAAAKQLEAQLRQLEGILELPEIAQSDEKYISEGGPELKLAFSMLRVSRGDEGEAALVRMIDQMEAGIPQDQPVIVPVYGRGRLLCALPAPPVEVKLRVPTPMGYRRVLDASLPAMLLPEAVEQVAIFMTGECSCEVKGLNPGTDALMAAGWDNFIDGTFVIDEAMPPLTSLPSFTRADLATAHLPAVAVKAPEPVSLQEMVMKSTAGAGAGVADSKEAASSATPTSAAPAAAVVHVADRGAATPATPSTATAAVVTAPGRFSSVWLIGGVVAVGAVLVLILGTLALMRRGAGAA